MCLAGIYSSKAVLFTEIQDKIQINGYINLAKKSDCQVNYTRKKQRDV
jgi:hypothetical protein